MVEELVVLNLNLVTIEKSKVKSLPVFCSVFQTMFILFLNLESHSLYMLHTVKNSVCVHMCVHPVKN